MQTAEPTAIPASSPIALVSVATAEVTNIIEKVTTISMIRAWRSDPEGDVVPICLIGCNRTRSVREADTAPVS